MSSSEFRHHNISHMYNVQSEMDINKKNEIDK